MAKQITVKTDKTKHSYLIQRLQKPHKIPPGADKDSKVSLLRSLSDSFSFGGGLKNGGLSKDAMSLLKKHFRFDYMGAAEYEWGAVPEAFAKLVDYRKKKLLLTMEIDPLIVAPPKSYFFKKKKATKGKKEEVEQNKEIPIYVICSIDHIEHIMILLYLLSKYDEYEFGIRDIALFRRSVHGLDDEYFTCRGWIELDNGFMFFTDKTMFEGVADTYGLTAKDRVTLSSEEVARFFNTAEKLYKSA